MMKTPLSGSCSGAENCDRDLPIPHRYQANTSDLAMLLADLLRRKAEARIAQTIDRLTPWPDASARGLTAA